MTGAFKWCLVAAIVAACIVMPWWIWHRAAAKSREVDAALRELNGQLSQATAENLRLSNLVARAEAPALSGEPLQELLRLRSEAGRLRALTNALPRLLEENLRLHARLTDAPPPPAPLSERERQLALASEILVAMHDVLLALQPAMEKFANDHAGETPSGFAELRKYFPEIDGRRMPGLYTFEFVRDRGPRPGDTLVLRESTSHRGRDGKPARVYGFRDGEVLEVSPPDGNFDAWERQQLSAPGSGR